MTGTMVGKAGGLVLVLLGAVLPVGAVPPPDYLPVQLIPGITPQELFPGATFSDQVPAPREVLGVELGSRPLRHGEILRYFRTLAQRSPRASLKVYSRTYEGRALVVLAVGEAETVAGLEAFQAEHARRLDPRGRPASEDAALVAEAKAVAWMAYAIHGDELSSADAAVALAYWLVAGEDERARALRRELVILIDPLENPDGRDRFLAQTTAFAHAVPNPDTDDLSHTTVWPWGRGNHYLFDLNRDWFTMVHPESRRSAEIARWHPQLMVDSHEMGSHDTYLFSPSRHPFNPHRARRQLDWEDRFGHDQARALDARGYGYYTREWNEEFFPGYGSSWATYRGAIGILYEMSGTEGTLVHQRGGATRTYAQAVEHQVTSSVANLESLARNRVAILQDFVASRRDVIRAGTEGPVRAWLFPPGRYPDRTNALAALLQDQGIEVQRLAAPVTARGLRDARTGETLAMELPAGTWLVPLAQPAGSQARVLLDPHVPMQATFLREEREYLERGKGSRLYETTAWSLPLAYGIAAYWTGTVPEGDWRAPLAEFRLGGQVAPAERPFGYLMDGASDRSTAALADLLQRDLRVRVADKPFAVGGRAYGRGTVLIRREENPDTLVAQLTAVAQRWGVAFEAATTARAEEGPDLGGGHFDSLVAPKVGIFTGMPVAPHSYGALWHLMDQRLHLRFSGLDIGRFSRTDLSRYNVLIFPPLFGGPGTYRHLLGKGGLAKLARWVRAGGTAIGIGTGAWFLAHEETELAQARPRSQVLETYPPVVYGLESALVEGAGRFRAIGVKAAPGKEEGAAEEKAGAGKKAATPPRRQSPYDVAPVLGAGARPFAAGLDLGTPAAAPVALEEWLKPLLPAGKGKAEKEDLAAADHRLRRFGPQGVFLRVELDPERWLNFGLPDTLAVFTQAGDALMAEPPVDVPVRFAALERLHLGGLLWPEAAGRIAHTAYLTRERVGRGQVICFPDEPVFRAFTWGTQRLLVNAVLYGPGLGAAWSNPW